MDTRGHVHKVRPCVGCGLEANQADQGVSEVDREVIDRRPVVWEPFIDGIAAPADLTVPIRRYVLNRADLGDVGVSIDTDPGERVPRALAGGCWGGWTSGTFH